MEGQRLAEALWAGIYGLGTEILRFRRTEFLQYIDVECLVHFGMSP